MEEHRTNYHIDHYPTITNRYSFQMFNGLSNSTEGNVFVSTYSIQLMLLLLAFGSKSTTQQQIKSVLQVPKHLPLNIEIMKEITKNEDPDILTFSNGIFVDTRLSLNQTYVDNARNYMNSTVKLVNFYNGKGDRPINSWIERSTNNKITKFFGPGSIDQDTSLILVSAVHFQNRWKYVFEDAKIESFCLTPKNYINVQMMQQTGFYYYIKDDENHFSAVEIPYRDSDYVMVIVLPDKMDGVRDLENMFKKKPKTIVSIHDNMNVSMVELNIPKFKFENEMSLQSTLEQLNCTDMFSSKADFSAMISNNSSKIKISSIIHKTFVEVNEKGTEAAGVTSARVVNYMNDFVPESYETVEFNACHPFLFIIKKAKNIIFMGRMSNPNAYSTISM